MLYFFMYLVALAKEVPKEAEELDEELIEYIDVLWEEGDPKGKAADTLSGLGHLVPSLRGKLRGAWSVYGAWTRHELPNQSPPLLGEPLDAVLGFLATEGFYDVCMVSWVMFRTIMRTDEAMNLAWEYVTLGSKTATFTLVDTKTSDKKGGFERTMADDEMLIRHLRWYRAKRGGAGPLLMRSPRQFRAVFAYALTALGLKTMEYKPYSLKRGGATQLFLETGSMDIVQERGRWNNSKTCRVYVNTALAAKTLLQLPRQVSLSSYAALSPQRSAPS